MLEIDSVRAQVSAWLTGLTPPGAAVSFALDPAGACILVGEAGQDVHVEVGDQGSELCLWSPILDLGGLPPAIRADRLERCLALNLFTLDTRGLILGMEGERRVLAVYRAEVAELDPVSFRNLLGSFIDAAAALRRSVGEGDGRGSPVRVGEPS